MTKSIRKLVNEFKKDSERLLEDNLLAEYLFGSQVKGNYNQESDIDILIIVKQLNPGVKGLISALSSEYSIKTGVVFSPILKDKQTWEKNKKYNTYFYNEILKYGQKL